MKAFLLLSLHPLMETLTWKKHFVQTFLLALPVCLSNVGNILVDLTDNFFIGQLPEKTTGQAAVSLSSALYFTVLVLLIGASYGLTPIVAEANAQNKKERITTHLRHAFVQNFAISVFLFFLLFFLAPLLRLTDRPQEVTDLAVRYLNVTMLSMIPLSIFFTCKQFAEGMSDTKAAMFVTIGSNAMNILLNYWLVFGKAGFPELGVMGACWATFISRCFMAVVMMAYVYFAPRYREYRPSFTFRKLSWQPVKEQLRIGVPSGLMFALEVAAFSVPTLFIPGTSQLAAHRVSMGLAAMTYMISSGLGAAATIRVGHFLGLKDKTGLRRAGFSAMIFSIAFMMLAAILFIIFRYKLTSLFNTDPEVLKYAAPLLFIAAAFQLFDGAQVTVQGALRGLKDTIVPGFIALGAYWVIGLPASWYLCTKMNLGVQGVWFGFILGLAAASFGFIYRFHKISNRPI
ncbi:MAG: MATE family efflux transporter [Bacteroidota bacterium]|nr:MATE family efflux transporter [Bacteroidota bacterium]